MRPPEGVLEIDVAGERLWLLPERAIYWPRQHLLLVADAHLGKAAAFRQAGFPIPSGTTEENLERLATLVERYRAARVVFLGDLVHSRIAREAASAAFARWRSRFAALDVVLVRGNHDRHAGDPGPDWRMTVVHAPHTIDAIALCHEPRTVPDAYALAGHTHPAARLNGRGRERMRLPCFFFGTACGILPAFGAFTGMADVVAAAGERMFVVAGMQVLAVQTAQTEKR